MVMDDNLEEEPHIEYPFISELVNNYEHLKKNFRNGNEEISKTAGWCDYMKFSRFLLFRRY